MIEHQEDLGPDLDFEHVGTMDCSGRLVLTDVHYLHPRFAGMRVGRLVMSLELEVEPGTWQVLVARQVSADEDVEQGEGETEEDRPIRFVLVTHERELEIAQPLESAQPLALLRVDSGRITILDPRLRSDPAVQNAVLEAPREQVPCMLRPLEAAPEDSPSGTLIDVDAGGVFELYAGPGEPPRSVFVAIPEA